MKKRLGPDRNRLFPSRKDDAPLADALLFDVSRTTDTTTLLTCRRDTLADNGLDTVEKNEICRAIEKRFAFLNATRGREQKTRRF